MPALVGLPSFAQRSCALRPLRCRRSSQWHRLSASGTAGEEFFDGLLHRCVGSLPAAHAGHCQLVLRPLRLPVGEPLDLLLRLFLERLPPPGTFRLRCQGIANAESRSAGAPAVPAASGAASGASMGTAVVASGAATGTAAVVAGAGAATSGAVSGATVVATAVVSGATALATGVVSGATAAATGVVGSGSASAASATGTTAAVCPTPPRSAELTTVAEVWLVPRHDEPRNSLAGSHRRCLPRLVAASRSLHCMPSQSVASRGLVKPCLIYHLDPNPSVSARVSESSCSVAWPTESIRDAWRRERIASLVSCRSPNLESRR